jgi:NADH-quinone oxidoreductase subunit M
MLGEVGEKNRAIPDLNWREIAVFAPLIAWAFWIGLNPQPYFRVLDRSVAQIVERVQPGYYEERHLPNPLNNARISTVTNTTTITVTFRPQSQPR